MSRKAKEGVVFAVGALIAVVSILSLLGWGTTRIVNHILFDIRCGGRITRAAHANTIELAKEEMTVVVKYLEDNNMTSGYTSIVYQTPDEDVGFWYKNLSSSLEELKHVKTEATQLEKSNLLLKLRETLQSHGEKRDEIIVPAGITVYPHNTLFAMWGTLSVIFSVIGILIAYIVIKVSD